MAEWLAWPLLLIRCTDVKMLAEPLVLEMNFADSDFDDTWAEALLEWWMLLLEWKLLDDTCGPWVEETDPFPFWLLDVFEYNWELPIIELLGALKELECIVTAVLVTWEIEDIGTCDCVEDAVTESGCEDLICELWELWCFEWCTDVARVDKKVLDSEGCPWEIELIKLDDMWAWLDEETPKMLDVALLDDIAKNVDETSMIDDDPWWLAEELANWGELEIFALDA